MRSSRNPRGYARVSADNQNPDLQYVALAAVGLKPDQIILDVETGTNSKRKGYQKICQGIHEAEIDLVVVNRIDRLGRDHYELISFLKLLETVETEEFSCLLASICEPFVLQWRGSSWAFRATWDAIGDARYELLRLKERQRQGIDAKKDPKTGMTIPELWRRRGPDKKPRRAKDK